MKKLLPLLILPFFLACGSSETKVTEEIKIEKKEETKVKEKEVDEFLLENMLKIKDEATLKAKYGAENVKRETQLFAEGTVELDVSFLFKGTDKEIRFMWEDDSVNYSQPISVHCMAKNSPWHTSNGIKVGLKMTDLEKIIGQPFEFYGFDWDFGGSVVLPETYKKKYNSTCSLGVCDEQDYKNPAYNKLQGDASFMSNTKNALALNPCIADFTVYVPD